MVGTRRWGAILVVAALAVSGFAVSATADASSESGFLSKINAERTAKGLAPVEMESGLRSYARTHSQFMADGKCSGDANICHSTEAQLKKAAGSGWTKIGENVGRGGSVDSLHKAFMDSTGHRNNILDKAWTHVGIGTLYANDKLYVTVVFMAKGKPKAPKESAPKDSAPKESKPKATTTTTTIPPTTTTTLVVGPDKPVTPGESCVSVARLWWTCHN